MSNDPVTAHAESPLFRAAALDAQRERYHGQIVLSQPMTSKVLAFIAAGIAVGVVVFGIVGTYTKRTTVYGQITPSAGLVKVYAQQAGIVVESRVVEGRQVIKGDVLYVLSSERTSSTLGGTQEAVSHQAELQKRTLGEQLRHTERLEQLERIGLERRVATLRAERASLDSLLAGQRERVALAERMSERYAQLVPQGFLTQDHLVQKQADLLDQRMKLEELERERIVVLRSLDEARNQLATLPLKYGNELGDLSRTLASTEQQLSESEARRRLVVVATETGIATTVNAHVGQTVTAGAPLVVIVPGGARLQAHLYAPSRAIGFVRPGDAVRLRYQAYPYQKFGQYSGRVASISRTAMSSEELTGSAVFASGPPGGEPLYRIAVNLQSAAVTAKGRTMPLETGMLLEADILQETRALYEWMLEPLYSVSKKL